MRFLNRRNDRQNIEFHFDCVYVRIVYDCCMFRDILKEINKLSDGIAPGIIGYLAIYNGRERSKMRASLPYSKQTLNVIGKYVQTTLSILRLARIFGWMRYTQKDQMNAVADNVRPSLRS